MPLDCDVLIVGSGPAGVSAAFPLVRAGLKVLMIDASIIKSSTTQGENADVLRGEKKDDDLYVIKSMSASSPKFRIPELAYVFDSFMELNNITCSSGMVAGSLSAGGLSNAWGAGVSKFSDIDLKHFPVSSRELEESYRDIARRIGISGGRDDDLSSYFGLDDYSQPSLPLDNFHSHLLEKYSNSKSMNKESKSQRFKMSQSRLAVLSQDYQDRLLCNLSRKCLWGCSRESIYSSIHDLRSLRKFGNFQYRSGLLMDTFIKLPNQIQANCQDRNNKQNISLKSKKIIVAAGTIASTKIIFKSVNNFERTPLLSCPTAAFLLWSPFFTGQVTKEGIGLGQLAINLFQKKYDLDLYGALFSPMALPLSEFVRNSPFNSRFSIRLFQNLLGACSIGNLFFPGEYGGGSVRLINGNYLEVQYSPNAGLQEMFNESIKILRGIFLRLGIILVPGSPRLGIPGSDIHYSGTIPMKEFPKTNETNKYGELHGFKGVYVADGSVLTSLPSKPHTLTIMANADRIGKAIANECLSEK